MEGFNFLTGFVVPYANLALFLFLASKVLKAPLLNAINSRRTTYDASLAQANEAKLAAQKINEELKQKKAGLQDYLKELEAKSQRQLEQESQKILEDAKALANQLENEAKRIADAEVNEAREEIRNEILEAVQKQVEVKLANKLDASAQQQIFSRQLQLVSQANGEA